MEKGIFYRFSKLELTQFATFEDNYRGGGENIEISCEFSFSYSYKQRMVRCTNSVSFFNTDALILKSVLDAYFDISSESVEALSDNGEVVLPSNLQAQFASLTYGTMRGVIFAKTQGSPLSDIVLPPSDVSELIKDSVRFKRKLG